MEILLVPNEVLRLKAQKLTKITKEDINIAHQNLDFSKFVCGCLSVFLDFSGFL